MFAVARKDDLISGMTTGEHSGHYDEDSQPVHSSSPITGRIISNCSEKFFIEGKAVALVGSVTLEADECCTSSLGEIAAGSSKFFINNLPVARLGDSIHAHNGSASISSGSSKFFIS